MRIARRLALLAVMAFAAMTMAATTASAAPIEVSDAATGLHCGAPGSGDPCSVHASGSSSLSVHIFGAEQTNISSCTDEFEAEIYEDGSGHATDYENNAATSAPCTRENCNGVGEAPGESEWAFTSNEVAPGNEQLIVAFCLDTEGNENATGTHCTLPVQISNDASGNVEGIFANDARGTINPAGVFCEVTGDWELETGSHEDLVVSH